MARVWLAAAVAILSATSVHAKLEIQNIQAVYGPLGPVRPALELLPHDDFLFRFMVTGAQVDAEGRIDATLNLRLTSVAGKVLLNQDSALKGIIALGGHTYVGNARLTLKGQIPAGDYPFTVTVKDNLSGETASFERTLTAKAPRFAIVSPQFFFDADGKVPAPVGGMVGQILHFRLHAVGFDGSQGKIDSVMEMQVLDAQGKGQLPKAMQVQVRQDDPKVVKNVSKLDFSGSFALNRAGDFTLRITVTDRIGNQTAKFETPLKVTAP